MRKYPLERYLVPESTSLWEALQRIEETERRTVYVVDHERRLLGSVTDGDIRRWLLAGGELAADLSALTNPHPITVSEGFDRAALSNQLVEMGATCVPLVDPQRRVIDMVFWEDVFAGEEEQLPSRSIEVPVVIMAGGRGTRMAPFTQVLPKPLLPVGDRTVIEIIIDRFVKYGIRDFMLTLNYKATLLKAFFQDLPRSYEIRFFEEERARGTAGGLSLLKDHLRSHFIVTNCDIVIEADCFDLVTQHVLARNQITMVVSLKKYHIPYGVCEIDGGGQLSEIREKPDLDFLVNTGMYVLSPGVLDHVRGEGVFHMTDLIAAVREAGGRVGVYPIGEGSWLDTGEWAEYRRTLKHFEARLLQ
jgi:dTDP-glucose pyrophosphorylase